MNIFERREFIKGSSAIIKSSTLHNTGYYCFRYEFENHFKMSFSFNSSFVITRPLTKPGGGSIGKLSSVGKVVFGRLEAKDNG